MDSQLLLFMNQFRIFKKIVEQDSKEQTLLGKQYKLIQATFFKNALHKPS